MSPFWPDPNPPRGLQEMKIPVVIVVIFPALKIYLHLFTTIIKTRVCYLLVFKVSPCKHLTLYMLN